eukprot:539426_1
MSSRIPPNSIYDTSQLKFTPMSYPSSGRKSHSSTSTVVTQSLSVNTIPPALRNLPQFNVDFGHGQLESKQQQPSLPSTTTTTTSLPSIKVAPKHLSHKIRLIKTGSGSMATRTRKDVMECVNMPNNIKNCLGSAISANNLDFELENCSFGWSTAPDSSDKTGAPNSIHSYDTKNVDWSTITYFTLFQNEKSASKSKGNKSWKNKKENKDRKKEMMQGDEILRSYLDPTTYRKIAKNARVFTGAKYYLGVLKWTWENTWEWINNQFDATNTFKNTSKSTSSSSSSSGMDKMFENCMKMMQMQAMSNMSQMMNHRGRNHNHNYGYSIGYRPQRGPTNNVEEVRYAPNKAEEKQEKKGNFSLPNLEELD